MGLIRSSTAPPGSQDPGWDDAGCPGTPSITQLPAGPPLSPGMDGSSTVPRGRGSARSRDSPGDPSRCDDHFYY